MIFIMTPKISSMFAANILHSKNKYLGSDNEFQFAVFVYVIT